DVDVVELKKRRRVIDEREAHAIVADALFWFRSRRRINQRSPSPSLPLRLPLQKTCLGLPTGIDIAKALAIEVIGARTAVTRRCEDEPLDRDTAGDRRRRYARRLQAPHAAEHLNTS